MKKLLNIDFDCKSIYNYSMAYNNIPLVEIISLENISDYEIKNSELEIFSEPEFFATHTISIPCLESLKAISLESFIPECDLPRLCYTKLPYSSKITLRVKKQDEIIEEESKIVEILPYDFFPSAYAYTEIGACFVTPEQPELSEVTDSVLKELYKKGIDKSNVKYGPEEVFYIFKAVYDAIYRLKITYNAAPVTIETKPAKVKLCESVIKSKSANAFEIALFFASATEALGLNPILIINNSHPLVGCFTYNCSFSNVVNDDGRHIYDSDGKLCDRLCIIDPTSVANGTHITFESSIKMASSILEKTDAVPVILDIACARENKLRPLPNRINVGESLIFEEPENYDIDLPQIKDIKTFSDSLYYDTASALKNALSAVDVSNPLISLNTSESIFLISGDMHEAETKLSNGDRLPVIPFVPKIDIDKFINIDPLKAVDAVMSAIDDNRLMATHSAQALSERIDEIKNGETYVVFGILEHSEKSLAPVILLPIKLSFEEDNVYIQATGNPKINKCLFEYLKRDMGISVLSSDMLKADILNNKEGILSEISEVLSNHDGFVLHDLCAITLLEYSDYEMSLMLNPELVEKCPLLCAIAEDRPFEYSPALSDFIFPLSLDLSQRKAVQIALNNKYTLIEGSYGSGKTETLLSLLLTLSNKKEDDTILFVAQNSEKYKELSQRLSELGIHDCCLFFDENNPINLSQNIFRADIEPERKDFLEKSIVEKISESNEYYTAVHKIREVGFSFFEAVSQFERYRSFPYTINFTNDEIKKLTKNDVVNWFDVVSNLAKAGSDCKEPFNNPLSFITLKNFSYEVKSEISEALTHHLEITEKFIERQNDIAEYFGIDVTIIRESQTAALIKMLNLALNDTAYLCQSFFMTQNKDAALKRLKAVLEYGNECCEIENKLNENFTDEILELDAKNLITDWRESGVKFALQRISIQSSIKNKIKSCAKPNYTLNNENILDILYLVAKYREYDSFINENSKDFEELFEVNISAPKVRRDTNTWKRLENIYNCLEKYTNCIYDIYSTEKKSDSAFEVQSVLFKNPSRVRTELKERFGSFEEFYSQYTNSESALGQLLGIDFTKAREKNSSIWYFFITKFLNKTIDNIDNLKYWCAYRVQRQRAIDAGLRKVVDEYENINLSAEEMKNAFLRGFFKAVGEYILSCEPSLGNFSGDGYYSDFEEMRQKLSEFTDISAEFIKSAYAKRISKHDKTSYQQLCSILQNPNKQNLDSAFWNSLLSVYKIIVTNNKSILKYLDNSIKFDTVLLDDADEYTLSKASVFLPFTDKLIAAGKPFSIISEADGFIDRTKKKENSFFAEMSKVISPCRLEWKYESLSVYDIINNIGHGSSLCGFPKISKAPDVQVQIQNGNYDRKSTRTNAMEAGAAVEELIKLIKNGISAGIYAATEEQARLIQEMLKKKIGSAAARACSVGSIYNKQFEQRDVIIFSTVYALDERPRYKDSITRNLGIIMSDNCKAAIFKILSLAKKGFVLITSLSSEILSSLKTTCTGYCDFKKILFSLFDGKNRPCLKNKESSKYENAVVHEIGNEILKKGYKISSNLESGDFRIDLAVKDRNDKYILGIIFDDTAFENASDFSIATRQYSELEKQGWKIIRIFSVEWFENYSAVMDRINRALESHFERDIDISIIQN